MNTENIYDNLKNKQQEFIRSVAFMAESEGIPVLMDSTYSRGWLRKVAKSMNIEWAPAWIVKDVSRQRGRGEYAVPEVYAYTKSDDKNPGTPGFYSSEEEKYTGEDIADRILGDTAEMMMQQHEAMEREMNGV